MAGNCFADEDPETEEQKKAAIASFNKIKSEVRPKEKPAGWDTDPKNANYLKAGNSYEPWCAYGLPEVPINTLFGKAFVVPIAYLDDMRKATLVARAHRHCDCTDTVIAQAV